MVLHCRHEVERWRPKASRKFRILSYADRRLPTIDPARYRTVIADEAHYLKNPESKRARLVCRLLRQVRSRVIAVTGTPVPNRPIELWPLLFAMKITDLGYYDFARRFAGAFWGEWGFDARGATNLEELREMLVPFMIRFTKADVLDELPSKTWRVLALALGVPPQEKGLELGEFDEGVPGEGFAFEALSSLLRLHGERKIPLALEHLRNTLEGVPKVVVFARHRDVIRGLVEGLEPFGPVQVTGDHTYQERQDAVDRFRIDPETRVFIGQNQAAGTGTDGLQDASSHAVLVEPSWVPGELEQMSDRVHRIGTVDPVTVDLLTIEGSIDEYMIRRALEKSEVIGKIIPDSGENRLTLGGGTVE